MARPWSPPRVGDSASIPNSPHGRLPESKRAAQIPTMTDQVGGNINDPLAATDLMMTNVTGFTVRALWDVPATGGAPGRDAGEQPGFSVRYSAR